MEKYPNTLSAERIKELIKNPMLPTPTVYDTVTSTNTVAKNDAAAGASQWHCVAAASQSAGRGRLGRSFYSPSGGGLYMSIVLRPNISADTVPQITGATAVAVCRAIEDCFSVSPEIKWVNDLYLNNKKICGILSEAVFGDSPTPEFAVVGIGINICPPKSGFPDEISDVAGSIFDSYVPDAANRLCAAVLSRMYDTMTELFNTGSEKIAAEYRRRCFVIGKEINIISNGSIIESAMALDVDDSFRLIAGDKEGGRRTALYGGEISIRLK